LTLTRRPTRSGHAAIKTPWTGPLACASDGVRNIAPHSLESDSDDNWEHVPGILKREPVIPQRITSTNDSESESESDLSSSSPPLHGSPPVEGHYIPEKPETQATYPGASSRIPSVLAHNNHPPPDLASLPIPRGIPVSQVSPHSYDSPSVSHKGLMSPTHPSYGVINLSASGHSSGYTLSPLIKSPNYSNLPGGAGYNPGFGVPTPVRSNTIPLPGIHHALANAPGSNSPFLYSTPRASPSGSMKGSSSPYVPAWISPHSAVNSVLPGTLTATMSPASVRGDDGAPLRRGGSGPGSYIVGSKVIAPY